MATPSEQERAAALAWNRRSAASLTRARTQDRSGQSMVQAGRSTRGRKPLEKQLREQGGRMAGASLGGLLGSAVPFLGTAIGGLLGGWFGKKFMGSQIGLASLGIIVLMTVFGAMLVFVLILSSICAQYRWTIWSGSFVSEYANNLNSACIAFDPK